MAEGITTSEQIRRDTTVAMKAGQRDRVGALRMLTAALQLDAKEGAGEELAVLRRERKRRLEAAAAFRDGGSPERAEVEEAEAQLIESYLPRQLDDDALAALVDGVIAELGAGGPAEIGRVIGAAVKAANGLADGSRVSAAVRERLGA